MITQQQVKARFNAVISNSSAFGWAIENPELQDMLNELMEKLNEIENFVPVARAAQRVARAKDDLAQAEAAHEKALLGEDPND